MANRTVSHHKASRDNLAYRNDLQRLYADFCGCKLLFLTGHDNAIIGVTDNTGDERHPPVVVYLLDTLIENLMADHRQEGIEAVKGAYQRLAGAHYGKQRPVFTHTLGKYLVLLFNL